MARPFLVVGFDQSVTCLSFLVYHLDKVEQRRSRSIPMEIYIGIVSAAIAASVSLIIAIISAYTNRNALKVEREKLERDLQRRLTEKLYDQRLETYPEAIAITDGLRRSRLVDAEASLTKEYFRAIIQNLDQWQNTRAGFLLSENSLAALNELRRRLREASQADGTYTSAQLDPLRTARRTFRTALRNDIILLYQEEPDAPKQE